MAVQAPSELLVLSASDVEASLPMLECIQAMSEALVASHLGQVDNPLRQILLPKMAEAKGLLGLMPAVLAGARTYGLKEVCVFPGNHAVGLDSHMGSVLLHDGCTGALTAILNGSAITAIRTAAATAVASRALARPESSVMALVGCGTQARWHLESLSLVHCLDDIRVCSANPDNAVAFASAWQDKYPIRAVEGVEAALAGCDILTTVTSSSDPVVDETWISDGLHINAVGSSVANRREIDGETVARSRLFVDREESTINEAGDYLLALAEGLITNKHIVAEVGAVIAGHSPGRGDSSEVTMFKSLGLAVEDLMAAEVSVSNARLLGLGSVVPF